jgi:probable blue pigment (indigoidine) exporter
MSAALSRADAARLALAAACWGTGTVASKQAVAEFPPLTLLASQLALSVAFLVVAARVRGVALPPAGLLGRLGILNPGLAYALGLLALTQMSASLAVVVWAIEPLLIVALAAAVLGERIGPSLIALSALAITGIVLVLYDPGATGALAGVAIGLAGVSCCAAYTVATRRWLPDADSTVAVVVWQQVYALALALGLVVVAGVIGIRVLPVVVTAAGAVGVVASGVIYYGLAYWFYLSALRHVPASLAAVSFYLIPVFGLATAFAFGDRLTLVQWVGALLVVGAVAAVAIRGTPGMVVRRGEARAL